MIQILAEVVPNLVSSGSLEDVQEVGSVCYKNLRVSRTLFSATGLEEGVGFTKTLAGPR